MDAKSRDVKQSAEFNGKTVLEALRHATEALGVSAEQVRYEIVRDSSHSILGLVRTGEVVIRAWVEAPAAPVATPVAPIATPVAPIAAPAAPVAATAAPVATPVAPVAPSPASSAPARRAPVGARGEEGEPVGQKGNPPELERVANEVLSTLLDKMGLLAAVEVSDRGGQADAVSGEVAPLVLNIVGDDLGALIGRRGETLRDLQFITRLIISRQIGTWPNVVLDVESYKAKRVLALQALAQRMADQVRRTGQAVALEPMPAHERRIVHLALRDDPEVYTQSTGEDEARKVQILRK
jgi:spoIIIJ-associated protein